MQESSSSSSNSDDLSSLQNYKRGIAFLGKSLNKEALPSRKLNSSSQLDGDFGLIKKRIKNRRILIVDDEPYNLMGLKVIIDACDEGKLLNLIID